VKEDRGILGQWVIQVSQVSQVSQVVPAVLAKEDYLAKEEVTGRLVRLVRMEETGVAGTAGKKEVRETKVQWEQLQP
jgi:hypothetical protein